MVTCYAEADNAVDRIAVLDRLLVELERNHRRVQYAPHRRAIADEIARNRHEVRVLGREIEAFFEAEAEFA